MTHINLDKMRCKGCGLCIGACPIRNIRMSDDLNTKGNHYAEIISKHTCTGCALCARMCPDVAITIEADSDEGAADEGDDDGAEASGQYTPARTAGR